MKYCAENAVFQGMVPIAGPPTLQTINGIGTTLIGNREHDAHTGTYVATQYFTFFFLPLFPLTCYRVKPAKSGGWYFLGKVPYGQAQKVHWGAFLLVVLYLVIATSVEPDQGVSTARQTLAPTSSTPLPLERLSTPELEPGTISIYGGHVTNTTSVGHAIESEFRLRFGDWRHLPSGYLDIRPPLGGSGPFYMRATTDSVKGASVSATGDTILWAGERQGDSIIGDYLIIGGRWKDQRGVWQAGLLAGQRIPDNVRPE